MSLEHCGGVFSGQVYCGLPLTWQEMKPELLQKHYVLRNGVLVNFQFSRSLVLLIFNIFIPLLFLLVYREFSNYYFITCIRKPARVFAKTVNDWRSLSVFAEISILDVCGVLNTPLRWCIGCNLDGVFLIKFLTLNILLLYLCIGNFFTSIL